MIEKVTVHAGKQFRIGCDTLMDLTIMRIRLILNEGPPTVASRIESVKVGEGALDHR